MSIPVCNRPNPWQKYGRENDSDWDYQSQKFLIFNSYAEYHGFFKA
jgi:hypothetical protein